MSNEINLFSYNITDKDNKYTLDDNPFISRRISSSLQEKLDEQSAVLQKNFKKHLSGTMLLGTLIIVGILTSIFSLILLAGSSLRLPMFVVGVVLVLVSFVLIKYKKPSYGSKNSESEDCTKEEDLYERVKWELGFPETPVIIDVLTYEYKMKNGEQCDDRKPGEAYFAYIGYLWIEEENLCISDENCVMSIPTASLLGYRKVDEKYAVSLWLKDEDPDSPEYAEYNIKEIDGDFHLKTYYDIMITHKYASYVLRVPCYDFPKICSLVDLKPISEE
ncbi:MAG: hypothetical protein E7627_01560 [Ruminococcaceae bacterium]|nr:hypothetical protein [Oscillospiraceae bacterium]